MVIRRTNEMFKGLPVFLVGETATSLSKHYDDGNGNLIEMPLTNVDIANRAVMSYTNNDGKVFYTQSGATEIITVNGKYAVTRNKIKTPKGNEKTMIGVWDTTSKKDKWFPEYKEEEETAKGIIVALRSCTL